MKDRIKALRKKKGITQTQLGEVLGVGQKSISMIEKGMCNPTMSQLVALSDYFEVSTDYILKGDEKIKDIEPVERDFLKIIRDNKTLYGSLIEMMESQKKVFNNFENFERLAA